MKNNSFLNRGNSYNTPPILFDNIENNNSVRHKLFEITDQRNKTLEIMNEKISFEELKIKIEKIIDNKLINFN